jgi:hypothetical protein
MQNPLSFWTRLLIQLLLMRPDVLSMQVTPWESEQGDEHLVENTDRIVLELHKDFLEQLLRKS